MEVFPINVELVSRFLKLLSNALVRKTILSLAIFLFLATDVTDVSPFHKIRLFDLIGRNTTF